MVAITADLVLQSDNHKVIISNNEYDDLNIRFSDWSIFKRLISHARGRRDLRKMVLRRVKSPIHFEVMEKRIISIHYGRLKYVSWRSIPRLVSLLFVR